MTAAAGHCMHCGVETFFARPAMGGAMVELDSAPHEQGTVRVVGDPRSLSARPVAHYLGGMFALKAHEDGEDLYRVHVCEVAA